MRGGAAAVIGYGAKSALMLGATMALARMLAPSDFGLVAMVTAFVGFSTMFRDFGLSTVTVQREDVSHDQVSTLFWINVAISTSIALLIAVCSPLIGRFYADSRLVPIALALATISLFDGLAIQHHAVLRRRMRFTAIAVIELLATSVGVTVGLSLAWSGAGYWALVAQQVSMVFTKTVLMWLRSGWTPGRPGTLSSVRSMLAFGRNLTGSRMAHYLTRNLDKILIGKIWSAEQLGFYHKADNGAVLPFQQAGHTLSRVAIPTLSRLQNDPTRYRSYFGTAALLVTAGGLPLVAFLTVDAGKIVRLFLGSQWIEAVPIVRILAPVAVAEMVAVLTRWVFVSLGNSRRLLTGRVIESVVKIAAMIVGVRWGGMGVAVALALTSSALILPALVYCFRGSPVSLADFAESAWRPLVAATAAAAAILGLHAVFDFGSGSSPAALAVDAPVFAAFYLVAWIALPNGTQKIRELFTLAKALRS